jgi:hypothetical protein
VWSVISRKHRPDWVWGGWEGEKVCGGGAEKEREKSGGREWEEGELG